MGRSARAWVCLEGHTKTSGYMRQPEDHDGDFCTRCGASLTGWCQNCGRDIGAFSKMAEPPSFCPGCGLAYPWIERRVTATAELLAETELSAEERQQVVTDVLDVVRDASRKEAAVARFRRLMTKAGIEAGNAVRSILVDVLSKVAEQRMFGA